MGILPFLYPYSTLFYAARGVYNAEGMLGYSAGCDRFFTEIHFVNIYDFYSLYTKYIVFFYFDKYIAFDVKIRYLLSEI